MALIASECPSWSFLSTNSPGFVCSCWLIFIFVCVGCCSWCTGLLSAMHSMASHLNSTASFYQEILSPSTTSIGPRGSFTGLKGLSEPGILLHNIVAHGVHRWQDEELCGL